ncbi:hypothetical protein ACUR5C_12050 [Aliikangiella sp. IMCC44653]
MNFLKPSKTSVALALILTSNLCVAADNNFSREQKELKIMSKIFETSLNEQTSSKAKILGSKKTQSTYLARQGMVFNFQFGRNSFSSASDWEQFGEGIGHLVGSIASEVGNAFSEIPMPEAPEPPEMPFEAEFNDKFEVYSERMEALERQREKNREQREEVRELQREIRALERTREREKDKSSIDKAKVKLEEKMAQLNAQLDEYKKSMQEYRAMRDKKYTESTQLKTDIIFSTLCDYGATLRSLDDSEYVTIIFNNYVKNQDKVFVFSAENVKDCRDKDKLVKTALSYTL